MMMNANDIFGWIAACLTIICYFSPIPLYFKLCRGKIRYNDCPNLKVLINYIICINWFLYSFLLKNNQIFICFLSGAFFSIICVLTFLIILAKIKALKSFLFALILLFYTILCYFLLGIIIRNTDIVGYICVIYSLLSLIEPFFILKKTIKYRNYKYIPIQLCIIGLVATTCWIIYGFMIINFHIIIPNLIGMVYNFILMFIWNIFKKRKPIAEEVANYSINSSKNRPENTVTIA